jgi:hypothetical protein
MVTTAIETVQDGVDVRDRGVDLVEALGKGHLGHHA